MTTAWTPTSGVLPAFGEVVLVWHREEEYLLVRRVEARPDDLLKLPWRWEDVDLRFRAAPDEFTHWAPLTAPKETL